VKPQPLPSLLLGLEPVQSCLGVARVMSEQKVPRRVEQRIVIKFLGENVPSAEIHHRLQQQYGKECLSRTRVFKWCKCFREGRERVQNEPHDRRPSSRLFGSGYAANNKPFLKRESGCFQNVGKNVLTPDGSTLKTDMCK
jgi:hypothetical protein